MPFPVLRTGDMYILIGNRFPVVKSLIVVMSALWCMVGLAITLFLFISVVGVLNRGPMSA